MNLRQLPSAPIEERRLLRGIQEINSCEGGKEPTAEQEHVVWIIDIDPLEQDGGRDKGKCSKGDVVKWVYTGVGISEWILGFDSGFNNRPLVSENSRQYCEGYLHGQQAWKDPAASPSLSSAASESSSLASLDADTIDPRLLDLNVYADEDLFKTPTQPLTATCSDDRKDKIDKRECHATPYETHKAERGSGHLLDINSTSTDFPFPTTASDEHEAFIPAPSWTPINARELSRVRSAPNARTPSPPLVTYDARGHINHMSPCVRLSLSMAKHARVAAEFLESQGRLDAAATAVVDAAHWEKKARRRQAKNESQNRIRAQQRENKSLRWT